LLKTAVIDNASLVYLSHLHKRKSFFHYLQNLFHTVYFPTEVVKEYGAGLEKEPHRQWILERLKPEQGFYRYCTVYDSIVMAIIDGYNGMDKGEAEAYAQLKKVNAHLIISDDKPFVEALKQLDKGIKVYSTLHIICWLEHSKLIPDWNNLIKEIHKIRPFKSGELREAYLQVAEQLGLNISKKIVSLKCSLSKIL
jgi:predicted nucleic acid-binding protein